MIAVVGAGLAGVTAARALVAAGHAVTLFDKSPRVGGRMATRRVELPNGRTATFDHGCQYLAATTPGFTAHLAELTAAGVLREWADPPAGFPARAPGKPWLIAPGGMRAVVEHLAGGLTVRPSSPVKRVDRVGAGWRVVVTGQPDFACDSVILTPTVPQAERLLFDSGVTLPADVLWGLRAVEYSPCWAVMAADAREPRLRTPADIDFIADNHAKGVSDAGPAWTLLASPGVSEAVFTTPPETVAGRLLVRPPAGVQLHRWKYCTPRTPYPGPCAAVAGLRLVVAGDGFGPHAGTAEGAYLSGLAAAAAVDEFDDRSGGVSWLSGRVG